MDRLTREVALTPKVLQVALYLGWAEAQPGGPASLRQMSAALGHPPSSVHRWLQHLLAEQIVVCEHQHYRLAVWPRPVRAAECSSEAAGATSAPHGTLVLDPTWLADPPWERAAGGGGGAVS